MEPLDSVILKHTIYDCTHPFYCCFLVYIALTDLPEYPASPPIYYPNSQDSRDYDGWLSALQRNLQLAG
jgi:hypothetical protein